MISIILTDEYLLPQFKVPFEPVSLLFSFFFLRVLIIVCSPFPCLACEARDAQCKIPNISTNSACEVCIEKKAKCSFQIRWTDGKVSRGKAAPYVSYRYWNKIQQHVEQEMKISKLSRWPRRIPKEWSEALKHELKKGNKRCRKFNVDTFREYEKMTKASMSNPAPLPSSSKPAPKPVSTASSTGRTTRSSTRRSLPSAPATPSTSGRRTASGSSSTKTTEVAVEVVIPRKSTSK